MTLTALRDHLISAAAGAALLGGGAAIVATKVDVAVHEERITQLETLNSNVEGLREDIADLRVELAQQERPNGESQ